MNLFRRRRIRYELPVSRSQVAMTKSYHTVSVQRAAQDRTVLWPALRIDEKAHHEAFGDPPVVSEPWKVHVNQRVSRGESLPRGRNAPKAIDDPTIPRQKIRVCREILFFRDLTAATPVLHDIHRIQR